MKKLPTLSKFLSVIFLFFIIFQSCTTKIKEDNTNEIKKIETKATTIPTDYISTLTKEAYLAMTLEDKKQFKQQYLKAFNFKNGANSCSCTNCCGVECPEGTKPRCACNQGDCNCQCSCACEPYGKLVLQLKYEITTDKENNITLTLKNNSQNTINNLKKSNLPNLTKIIALFNSEPILQKEASKLSEKKYLSIESKFQQLVGSYSIKDVFTIEYEL
ncbi:MAG: hypothetical protein ACWA45_09810 [Flavobacteriales bacterium]